ncbi:MAG: hypothetical protein KAX49_09855 [Halanaerobiales bacterium]|nr:hypothetical protein [Halanaerobiales bacterium]
MGNFWTLGITWGILAWIPYFADTHQIFKTIFGLPVLLAGYLTLFLDIFFGSIPNVLSFCLSLPTGIALSWMIMRIFAVINSRNYKELEKEV